MLRIEDIDAPRCDPAHGWRIIESLAQLGLEWDGPIEWQSGRLDRYQEVFEQLRHAGRIYPCACTRAVLRDVPIGPGGERPYPGNCRHGLPDGAAARTWRFRLDDRPVNFLDRRLSLQRQCPHEECGDFVVRRADGLFAYQLVVVIDDHDQGVTDIVRGVDLLSSCGRQLALIEALGYAQPRYLHLPVLCDKHGHKLSKQTGAIEINWQEEPEQCLNQALLALGQHPQAGSCSQILSAAVASWDITRIPASAAPAVDESDSAHDDSPD